MSSTSPAVPLNDLVRAAEGLHDELLERHRDEVLERVAAYRRRYPFLFAGDEMRLRPIIVTDTHYRAIQQAAAVVVDANWRLTERLLASEEARRVVGFPAHFEPILHLEPASAKRTILGRLDGHLTPDGTPRFIEYNSAAAGISEMDLVAEMLGGTPVARELAAKHPFREQHLAEEGRRALWRSHDEAGREGAPTVAVLRSGPDVTQGASGSGSWLCYAASRHVKVVRPTADELSFENGRLVAAGEPIDMIGVMTSHLLRQPTLALFEAIQSGAVQVMHGVGRSWLAAMKTNFAVLSDPDFHEAFAGISTPEVRRLVPWTRRLVAGRTTFEERPVDLLELVSERREEFVIKPDGNKLGEGVVIGPETNQETWEASLASAVERGNHVVQQFVPPARVRLPVLRGGAIVEEERFTDLDPYIWNGNRPGGAVVRFNAGDSLELSSPGRLGALWRLLEDES